MARVQVRVSADGRALKATERYVAVVAGEKVLWEAVFPAGQDEGEVAVPAGTYTLVCAAVAHTGRSLHLTLRPGQRVPLDCPVRPLVPVRGQVRRADTGEPVAGTRVEELSLTLGELPVASGQLRQLLAKNLSALTDAQGRFQLWAKAGSQLQLVVGGNGWGKVLLPPVRVGAKGSDLDPVALQPGGSVEVAVQLPAEELAEGGWWVELSPQQQQEADGPEREDPSRARWAFLALFSASLDPAGRVELTDVPPGNYGAMLTTLPERVLRKTSGTLPEGQVNRPTHYAGPAYLPPGGHLSLELKPTRTHLEVEVAGLLPEACQRLVPWVFLREREFGAEGKWQVVEGSLPRFSALLEAEGLWMVGLTAQGEGGTRSVLPLGSVQVRQGQRVAHLSATLAVAPLRGNVVDGQGRAVSWAEVSLADRKPCAAQHFYWQGRTDAAGTFTVPYAPKVPLFLWAYHPAAGTAYVGLEEPEDVSLRLAAGKQVTLVLRDEKGNPVFDGVQVVFRPLLGEELTVGYPNAEGELTVSHLPDVDGELVVVDVSAAGRGSQRAVLRLSLGKGERGYRGVFTLERGAQVSWLAGARSAFLDGAAAVLLERDGELYGRPGSLEGLVTGWRRHWQRLELQRLPPGRYRAVAVDETCKPLRFGRPFSALAGEVVRRQD